MIKACRVLCGTYGGHTAGQHLSTRPGRYIGMGLLSARQSQQHWTMSYYATREQHGKRWRTANSSNRNILRLLDTVGFRSPPIWKYLVMGGDAYTEWVCEILQALFPRNWAVGFVLDWLSELDTFSSLYLSWLLTAYWSHCLSESKQ